MSQQQDEKNLVNKRLKSKNKTSNAKKNNNNKKAKNLKELLDNLPKF